MYVNPAFRAQEVQYVLNQSKSSGVFVVDQFRGNPMRATVQAANRFTPKGGVIMPSARFTTMMMPKCTGSMPKCIATGTRIGASTMIAALVSMNMPIRNSAALTPSRNSAG